MKNVFFILRKKLNGFCGQPHIKNETDKKKQFFKEITSGSYGTSRGSIYVQLASLDHKEKERREKIFEEIIAHCF